MNKFVKVLKKANENKQEKAAKTKAQMILNEEKKTTQLKKEVAQEDMYAEFEKLLKRGK